MATALFAIAGLLTGLQIDPSEWKLLSGSYHYHIGKGQFICYLFSLLLLITMLATAFALRQVDSPLAGLLLFMIVLTAIVLSVFICEWVLSKKAPGETATWCIRFSMSAAGACLLSALVDIPHPGWIVLYSFAGIFLRKSPFGIPYKQTFCLAYKLRKKTHAFEEAPQPPYVGCQIMPNAALPIYNVLQHGLVADGSTDQTALLNQLIDRAGAAGGGVIYFPKGRYYFKTSATQFVRINHSHIYLEGETDNGEPAAELICGGNTAEGRKNPWISPFFLTTGEALQPSNEFFGLQFRKRKCGFSQSNSLSDPGSDGEILTPEFATVVTQEGKKGDTLLHVQETNSIGRYILLGLYNTSPDGNLIKDILGVEQLRQEWTTALRAGTEEAPSYQWLAEVKTIVDKHTIELARPLLRDVEMKYTPVIHNVAMLEDIRICNLKLSSRWNGKFRHHGFPIYYNVKQAQEMDYGWNAINMKRVAHGVVRNVKICNFTNPLYVLDSCNMTAEQLEIAGYDGHQGIKIYQHACNNLFQHIVFRCNFADMMGGEGNAYGNHFRFIEYLSPVFNPVDFDFHGFSEGPMSPPSDNIFEHIRGFRYLKGAGSITHLPSLAQRNLFRHINCEGERRGSSFYYAMTYRPKMGLTRFITAVGFAAAMVQKKKKLSPTFFLRNVKEKLLRIDEINTPLSEHKQFFVGTITNDIDTWSEL